MLKSLPNAETSLRVYGLALAWRPSVEAASTRNTSMTMNEHSKADRGVPWSDAARQNEEGQSEFIGGSPGANNPPDPPAPGSSPDAATAGGSGAESGDEQGPEMTAGLFTGG